MAGIGVLLVYAGTAGTVFLQKQRLEVAQMNHFLMQQDALALEEQLMLLGEQNTELVRNLDQGESRLGFVSRRLDDIEALLAGETGELSDAELEERLENAALNSAIRFTFLNELPNGAPAKNARISSRYGTRIHPISKKKSKHHGLDYAVNTGTPLYATADGVVETVRPSDKGSGNFLRLQHSFGFTTSYSHMQRFNVRSGQFVRKGDLVGTSGNTGLTSGPHLHFEVRFVGRSLDPLSFVNWDLDNFESIFSKEKAVPWGSIVNRVEQRVMPAQQLLSSQAVVNSTASSS